MVMGWASINIVLIRMWMMMGIVMRVRMEVVKVIWGRMMVAMMLMVHMGRMVWTTRTTELCHLFANENKQ